MMPILKSENIRIASSLDIVQVRHIVREFAILQGMSLVDQTKIVTAASEIARNTLDYGGGGTALIEALTEGQRRGVRLTFEDNGPGIEDIERAMTDGFTSGKGMGLGLSGARRLSNEFDIVSEVGVGTRVTFARWK